MGDGQAGESRQEERSRLTRERVLSSTVSLICDEGFPSASPVKITQHTGMSWGAVQHHFGSKEQLLKTIVLRSRDQFNDAVAAEHYTGLSLEERISLFVDTAWQHYQSDVFRASVEITFWHRNNGLAVDSNIAMDNGRTGTLNRAMIEKVFAGTGAQTSRLQAANEYMHCVLTGMAFHKILTGGSEQFTEHLRHCKDAMAQIISRAEPQQRAEP